MFFYAYVVKFKENNKNFIRGHVDPVFDDLCKSLRFTMATFFFEDLVTFFFVAIT